MSNSKDKKLNSLRNAKRVMNFNKPEVGTRFRSLSVAFFVGCMAFLGQTVAQAQTVPTPQPQIDVSDDKYILHSTPSEVPQANITGFASPISSLSLSLPDSVIKGNNLVIDTVSESSLKNRENLLAAAETSYTNLKAAVTDTAPEREYNLETDENLTENLGAMGGANSVLTINGNGYGINGSYTTSSVDPDTGEETTTTTHLKGITVGSGQTLNINDVEANGGFNGFYAAPDGGVLNIANGGVVNINNSVFTDNSASYKGGVMRNQGTVVIEDSLFENNTINNNAGGVLFLESNSTTTINNSNFVANGNNMRNAAAIYNLGNTAITDSTFTSNTASNGGAIYNAASGDKALTVSNSKFEKNYSTASGYIQHGGAIYNVGTMFITDSEFKENYTISGNGGAISNSGNMTITDSKFTDNYTSRYNSNRGGAIENTGTLNFVSTEKGKIIFERNVAQDSLGGNYKGGGGAIYNTGTINGIDGLIFRDNSSGSIGDGGAIYNSGIIRSINNTLFEGNNILRNTSPVIPHGGAIYNVSTRAAMNITNSEFRSNVSTRGSAGAIYNTSAVNTAQSQFIAAMNTKYAPETTYTSVQDVMTDNGFTTFEELYADIKGESYEGEPLTESTLISVLGYADIGGMNITDSVFDSNVAGTAGGAIWNSGTLNYIATKAQTISKNSATAQGGAIYNQGSLNFTGGEHITFDSNEVAGNNTSYGGGAIWNAAAGVITGMNGMKFSNNSASGNSGGGAIRNEGLIQGGILNTTFTANGAGSGGAIYNTATDDKALTVTDSIFTDNIATNQGGAIYNSGTVNYTATKAQTISGNTAGSLAGAIFNLGTLNFIGGEYLTFNGNETTKSNANNGGGAIYNAAGGVIAGMNGMKFRNNAAYGSSNGGAIRNQGLIQGGIKNSIFTSNTGYSGGAIYNTATGNNALTVKNSTFKSNKANYQGSAVYNTGTTSIIDSIFNLNESSHSGAVANTGKVSIVDSKFNFNKSDFLGGAVYNTGTALYTATKAQTISDNTAERMGGAIFNSGTLNFNGGDYITFDNNKVTGNNASYGGGAIYNDTAGTITCIDGMTFSNNVATGVSKGGAIRNEGLIQDGIANATFTSNSSKTGGAIYNNGQIWYGIVNSTFTSNTGNEGGAINNNALIQDGIIDTTFTSNTATAGGAIYNTVTDDNALNIIDSTFTDNTASAQGGAIYNSGTVRIAAMYTDSVFSGNKAGSNANDIHNSGTMNLQAANGHKINFAGTITDAATPAGTTVIGGDYEVEVYDDEGRTTTETRTYTGEVNFANKVTQKNLEVNSGTVNANGVISVREAYTQSGGTVNANAATTANESLTISGGTFNANAKVTTPLLTLSGGTLHTNVDNTLAITDFAGSGGGIDMLTGAIENQTLGNVNLSDTVALAIDVALNGSAATNRGDKILATTLADGSTGTIDLNNVTVIADSDKRFTKVYYTNNVLKNNANTQITSVTGLNGTVYGVTSGSDDNGAYLVFKNDDIFNLVAAVREYKGNVAGTENPEYKLTSDVSVVADIAELGDSGNTGSIGQLGGGSDANFTIDGAGFGINGGSKQGINLASGQTLNIKNVGSYTIDEETGLANITNNGFSGFLISGSGAGGSIAYGSGNVNIENSVFVSNNSVYGGVLQALNLNIKNSIFKNNTGTYSGGVVNLNNNNKLNIQGSQFIGNNGTRFGGVISSQQYGQTITIADSLFKDNTAQGGGVINTYCGYTITNSVFDGNKATSGSGGAIYAYLTGGNYANLIDTDFINNSATGNGGALAGYSNGYANWNITAKNKNVLFDNNTANGRLNDIYHGRVTLMPYEGKNITFGGTIESVGAVTVGGTYNETVHNDETDTDETVTKTYSGAVNFNNTVGTYDSTIRSGTANANARFSATNMVLTGGVLNITADNLKVTNAINNSAGTINLGEGILTSAITNSNATASNWNGILNLTGDVTSNVAINRLSLNLDDKDLTVSSSASLNNLRALTAADGARINSQNDKIDNFASLGNVKLDGTLGYAIDLALNGTTQTTRADILQADSLNADSTGSVYLDSINLIAGSDKKYIKAYYANGVLKDNASMADTITSASYDGVNYSVKGGSDTDGAYVYLTNENFDNEANFVYAVRNYLGNTESETGKLYTLNGDIDIAADIAALGDTLNTESIGTLAYGDDGASAVGENVVFTIDGQGHGINANGKDGILAVNGQQLNIKNVGAFSVDPVTGAITVTNDGFTGYNSTNTGDGTRFISASNLLFENSVYSKNVRSTSGAFYVDSATIKNSLFKDNYAAMIHAGFGAGGGAIYINTGTNLNIDNTIFTNNMSGNLGDGGGAIGSVSGMMTINNSLFDGNYSGRSGGAIIQHRSGNNIIIRDTDFKNNVAALNGGALAVITQAGYGTSKASIYADTKDVNFINNYAGASNIRRTVSDGNVSITYDNTNAYANDIYNTGILYLYAGNREQDGETVANKINFGGSITGTGTTNIGSGSYTGIVNFGSSVQQGNLTINAGTVNAEKNLNIEGTTTQNGGVFNAKSKLNTANLNVTNGELNADDVVTVKNFNMSGGVANINNTLTGTTGKISGGTLNIKADNLIFSNSLGNKGTGVINLDDGTLNSVITNETVSGGNGTLNIVGDVVNNSTITQNYVNVNTDAKLVNNQNKNLSVANLNVKSGAELENNGTITYTASTAIVNSGVFVNNGVVYSGELTNNTSIANNNDFIFTQGNKHTGKFTGDGNGTIYAKGITLTINKEIANQTLSLDSGSVILASTGSLTNNVGVTANGGSFDTRNNQIDSLNLGQVVLNEDLKLAIDANVQTAQADMFSASSLSANGHKLLIDDIKVLADGTDKYVYTQVVDDVLKGSTGLSHEDFTANKYSGAGSYTVTYTARGEGQGGWLTFDNSGINNLVIAARTAGDDVVYAMASDESIKEDLDIIPDTTTKAIGAQVGKMFTINGGGHAVNGSYTTSSVDPDSGEETTTTTRLGGITVASSKTLNVNNVGAFTRDAETGEITVTNDGFNGFEAANGGVINNAGTVNIENSVFSNNNVKTNGGGYGGAVYNSGNLSVKDSIFTGNVAYEPNNGRTRGRGGAIYNTRTANIVAENSDILFKNNIAYQYGGAIFNSSTGTLNLIQENGNKIIFENNSVPYIYNTPSWGGGAIYNAGIITGINSIVFRNNTTNSGVSGGAVNNDGLIQGGISNSTFTSNSAGSGGAIYNTSTGAKALTIADSIFTSNSANNRGGAIWNSGTVNYTATKAQTISGNTAVQLGGAIYNEGTFNFTGGEHITFDGNKTSSTTVYTGGAAIHNAANAVITGLEKITFTNNVSALNGGAIYNNQGKITNGIVDSVFTTNRASYGGAIYNTSSGSNVIKFVTNTANTVSGNIASTSGGFLANNGIFEFVGGENLTITKNSANATSGYNGGGAIYNLGTISGVNGIKFIENTARLNGGAIYNNTGSFAGGISNSTFTSNSARDGGAILNTTAAANAMTIYDSTFTSNTASGQGGAIWNKGTVGIVAMNKDSIFSGNKAGSNANDIYNIGTLNLNAGSYDNEGETLQRKISFSGTIIGGTGSSTTPYGVINVNSAANANTTGKIEFNDTVTGNKIIQSGGTVEFKNAGSATVNRDAQGNVTGVTVSKANTYGGSDAAMVQTNAGELIINNSVFANNKGGGVNVADGATASVTGGSVFYSNTALNGGAINNAGHITGINDVVFKNNISSSTNQNDHDGGGAIYNNGNIDKIVNAVFMNNKANVNAGSITNFATISEIKDSVFIDNSSENYGGGAIFNWDDASISFSGTNTFTNNSAGTVGGAIVNRGTIALNGSNSFSNNTDSSGANDIYNIGAITLGANSNTTINDGITGDNSGTIAMASGAVLNANAGVSGNNLSMSNSTINLGSYPPSGTTTTYGSLNLVSLLTDATSGSLINSQNTHIDNTALGAVTLNSDLKLTIDANVETAQADYFSAQSISANGHKLLIDDISILADSGYKFIYAQVVDDTLKAHTGLSHEDFIVGKHAGTGSYTVTYTARGEGEGGWLTFNNGDVNNLVIAARTAGDDVLYVMVDDENIKEDLNIIPDRVTNAIGAQEGTEFTINGNGHAVTGSYTDSQGDTQHVGGITVGADKSLNINNVGAVDSDGNITNKGFNGFAKVDGGVIYANGAEKVNVEKSVFTENQATRSAAAIYTRDTDLSVKDSLFKDNSAVQTDTTKGAYGGAVYAIGNLDIVNSTFDGNKVKLADGAAAGVQANGGAIYMQDGDENITGSKFTNNEAQSYGGAIASFGSSVKNIKISDTEFDSNKTGLNGGAINVGHSNMEINNSTFTNNQAGEKSGAIFISDEAVATSILNSSFTGNKSVNMGGGAVQVTSGQTYIDNNEFTQNTAGRGGGALYLMSQGTVKDSTITSNKAGSYGGAIENDGAVTAVKNSEISSNTAQLGGGAIDNYGGTVTSVDTNYTNNATAGQGGAIWNELGTVNVIADSKDVSFNDNKAGATLGDTVSGGRYNDVRNDSSMNLNAASGKAITFAGTVEGSNGVININKSNLNYTTTERAADGTLSQKTNNLAPVGGNYEFDNTISGNTVNIYDNAQVKLGSKVQSDGTTTYGTLDVKGLTNDANGGVIDQENNNIDTNSLGTVTLGSDLGLKIDAKLDGDTQTADNYSAGSVTDGDSKFNISDVKIMADSEYKHTHAQVAKSDNLNDRMDLADNYTQTTSTSGKVYKLGYNDGWLEFNNTSINNLVSALRDGEASYDMTDDEDVVEGINTYSSYNNQTDAIGSMPQDSFTVNGNGHDINGGNKGGISVGDKELTVNNVGSVNGFTTAISVGSDGTANINGTKFENNAKDVSNDGKLNLYGANEFNSGIDGLGSTEVKTGTTTFNEKVTQSEVKVASGAELINKSDITADNLVNNGVIANTGNLVSGKLDNKSAINNDGKLVINDSASSNSGSISGNGDTTVNGSFNNTGLIKQNSINVGNNGEITTNSEKLISTKPIQNNGTINYTSGRTTVLDIEGSPAGNVNISTGNNFIINNKISGTQLSLNNGTVYFGNNADVSKAASVNLNGAGISVMNNKINNYKLGTVNLNSKTNLALDFDIKNLTSDKFAATVKNNGGIFNVNRINVIGSNTLKNSVKVHLGDTTGLGKSNLTSEKIKLPSVMTPIRKLDGMLENGYITYQGSGNGVDSFNPAVMASPVATQVGGIQNQIQTLQSGFYHMSRYTKYSQAQRMAAENINKYAVLDNPVGYKDTTIPETSKAFWTEPYATYEHVNLRGGLKVENFGYGALYGGDTDLNDLGRGWKNVGSAFIGYNGNHSNYRGISMDQEGGIVGGTTTFYKGNFFTGVTASVGAGAGQAYTPYGTDHYAMMNAGMASKTGYNLEFKEGRLILQPSLYLGYSMVNTFDYKNSAGAKIDSDPVHSIQISPGVKFIANLKNGWQPYADVSMMWNIIEGGKVMAEDARLPQLSLKPYIQYGVGLQKSWGEKFTAYGQVMMRNGGRNGIAATAGFRWTIGSNSGKDNSKSVSAPQGVNTGLKANKTVIKRLNDPSVNTIKSASLNIN